MRLALLVALVAGTALAGTEDTFVVRGATIHPVTGAAIENGTLYVRDGQIAGVGKNLAVPKGVRVIDARGLHVYPGMIDSATELGLSEVSAVRETVDVNELGEFNPQLRAVVAVNPSSEHIPVTRANGTTTALTLPAQAGGGGGGRGRSTELSVIAGQASLIHLDGWTWEEMEVRRSAAMVLRFPSALPNARAADASDDGPGSPRTTPEEVRRRYQQQMRGLNEFFEAARRYQQAKSAQDPALRYDLKFEAMLPVLEGKLPVMVLASRSGAISEAIDFANRQKIRIVLQGTQEMRTVLEKIKTNHVAVICGPTLALPAHEDDPYDAAYTLPNDLYKAGIQIAFGSYGNQFARDLPYQAAMAVAFGLPYDEALKAVTINAAQIWGLGDKLGAIEEGKWADLMITDGDPLETRTQVKQLFIKGKTVDLDNKHQRLYEKYKERQ